MRSIIGIQPFLGQQARAGVNQEGVQFTCAPRRCTGAVSDYRLARLIKYSFYKNIAFSFTFFFFQFFNGWSGQARAYALAQL